MPESNAHLEIRLVTGLVGGLHLARRASNKVQRCCGHERSELLQKRLRRIGTIPAKRDILPKKVEPKVMQRLGKVRMHAVPARARSGMAVRIVRFAEPYFYLALIY